MEKDYRVTKDQRKALVTKIAELTGDTAEYQGAPTFDYRVGMRMQTNRQRSL